MTWRSWSLLALLAGAPVIGGMACANDPLQRVPPPVISVDDQLALQGQFCTQPPTDAVFPVKILFLVDVSGSMIVTDPAKVRVQGVNDVINKYEGLPGVEFAVITFSSAIVPVTTCGKSAAPCFQTSPDMSAVDTALQQADNLTDDQGVLGAAYELLSSDMLQSTPAERARSKYIIIFFTDGIPDPVCSADTTPCGSMKCSPGNHCDPTTILNASNQEQEQYSCDPDYLICSVPKMNWGSAFNPPLNPALYPALQAGANYNTTPQLISAVDQIMALQGQYHVGSITLNTNFLFPVNALSNPLAVPFGLDRPAGDALLSAMAAAGNGTFQEFTDDTQISFLNINFSSVQVQNTITQSFASNQTSLETGGALVLDTDGDGLSDYEETMLGTCVSIASPGAHCATTPWDSDGDGYSDFIEVLYKTSGFDPLDPTKPATPCGTPGIDHDGDGLMDCEEGFLGTDPQNPDTDGDFLSDLIEIRNEMNPLDPTDAYGDINRDGILNLEEIKDGLSPFLQVSPSERALAFSYNVEAQPSVNGTTGTCYNFSIQHMRLLTTGPTANSPEGSNRIYYDIVGVPQDSPTNFATIRRACVDVLYVDGKVKLPLTGVVNFQDSDFVDIAGFNPALDCKNLSAGAILDGGVLSDSGVLVPITPAVDTLVRDGGVLDGGRTD